MNTVIKVSRELHKGTGKNLARVIKDTTINATNGAETKSGGNYCTDYIQVNENNKYSISGIQDTAFSFVALYDSNKAFIGRTGGNAKTELIIDNFDPNTFSRGSGTKDFTDIKYLRFTNYLLDGQYIDMDNIFLQVELGTTPTPYEPYKNNYLPRHLLNRRSVIFE